MKNILFQPLKKCVKVRYLFIKYHNHLITYLIFVLDFNISKDVAGATIMAASTSSPLLFINCIGTFVTKNNLGVGAIVGSAVFNILAVPACCALFLRSKLIKLEWWPLTRDCSVYGISVFTLIIILMDNRVMWYEAVILLIMYFSYLFAMWNNETLSCYAHSFVRWVKDQRSGHRIYKEVTEFTPLVNKGMLNFFFIMNFFYFESINIHLSKLNSDNMSFVIQIDCNEIFHNLNNIIYNIAVLFLIII